MLAAFEARAQAASAKVVLYDATAFSPCQITLRSLSVATNRYTSAAAFSLSYGESEILFFSPTFDYDPSYYFLMQKADAVFFGALGEQKETSVFPSTDHLGQVAFFCADENKTPFKSSEGCAVTQTHSLLLER